MSARASPRSLSSQVQYYNTLSTQHYTTQHNTLPTQHNTTQHDTLPRSIFIIEFKGAPSVNLRIILLVPAHLVTPDNLDYPDAPYIPPSPSHPPSLTPLTRLSRTISPTSSHHSAATSIPPAPQSNGRHPHGCSLQVHAPEYTPSHTPSHTLTHPSIYPLIHPLTHLSIQKNKCFPTFTSSP